MLDFYSYYMLPLSHTIGMTLEQFWDDDPYLFFAYLDAYNENEKNKMNMEYIKCYLNGTYTLLALQQVLQFNSNPKRIFPEKPFSNDSEQKRELSIEEENEVWKGYFLNHLEFNQG